MEERCNCHCNGCPFVIFDVFVNWQIIGQKSSSYPEISRTTEKKRSEQKEKDEKK
jgi:hypothetical protein